MFPIFPTLQLWGGKCLVTPVQKKKREKGDSPRLHFHILSTEPERGEMVLFAILLPPISNRKGKKRGGKRKGGEIFSIFSPYSLFFG